MNKEGFKEIPDYIYGALCYLFMGGLIIWTTIMGFLEKLPPNELAILVLFSLIMLIPFLIALSVALEVLGVILFNMVVLFNKIRNILISLNMNKAKQCSLKGGKNEQERNN